jgi:hypothetical protein
MPSPLLPMEWSFDVPHYFRVLQICIRICTLVIFTSIGRGCSVVLHSIAWGVFQSATFDGTGYIPARSTEITSEKLEGGRPCQVYFQFPSLPRLTRSLSTVCINSDWIFADNLFNFSDNWYWSSWIYNSRTIQHQREWHNLIRSWRNWIWLCANSQ